jgi:hypothetical protein
MPVIAENGVDREAWLRVEFAEWYPVLSGGEWIRADLARSLVERQFSSGAPTWERGARALSPRHFLFRGGEAAGTYSGADRRHSLADRPPADR